MRCPLRLVHPLFVSCKVIQWIAILHDYYGYHNGARGTKCGYKIHCCCIFPPLEHTVAYSAGTRLLVRRSTKLVAKKLIRKKSSSRSCQCCHLTEKFWWNIYFSVPKLFNYYIGTTSPNSRQYRALHITECAVQSQSRIQKYRGCFSRFFTVLRYKIFLIKSCGWLLLWSTIWYLGWFGLVRAV